MRHVSTMSVGCSNALLMTRRTSVFDVKTKGSPFMKHLDLYARRDPQLAPYLLREVDIEYKRKCRKVNFMVWTAVLTLLLAYQYRLQTEELNLLRSYASYVRAEQDARDEDHMERRRLFVLLSNLVKDAFFRSQQWTPEDQKKALDLLQK